MLILLAIGVVGGVAQVLLTEAYASAQVSALGAFSYTGICGRCCSAGSSSATGPTSPPWRGRR
jgi:hypothetical protein